MATIADGATNTTSADMLIRLRSIGLVAPNISANQVIYEHAFFEDTCDGKFDECFFFSETYLFGSRIQRGTFKMQRF